MRAPRFLRSGGLIACLDAYWCGGSRQGRRDADLGGAPWFPTPWRWGYGHAYMAGYASRAASD